LQNFTTPLLFKNGRGHNNHYQTLFGSVSFLSDLDIKKLKAEKLRKMQETMHQKEVKKLEVKVNDENFEKEVIEKSKTVLVVVDFWATWCMPCLMLSPVLEKLVKEFNGKFVLAKVNVDESHAVSAKYEISGIPAVKMFKGGKVTGEFIGALPEPNVRQWLDKNLG